MYLVATDILAELCGLSFGLIVGLVPVGLMLALFGWWSHRFWIVLATTVVAGVFGLNEAVTWHAQPIIVAVLLAIAAGILALSLVRVITFLAGGLAGVYFVHFAFPSLNQQAICFLLSGLVCMLLFRWFFMALTSFLGCLILAYGTLALLHYNEMLDAVAWSDDNSFFLVILCGIGTAVGFGIQVVLDRWRKKSSGEQDEDGQGDFFGGILGRIGFGDQSRQNAA